MANDHIADDRKKVRLIDANEFWNRLSHVVYDIFTVHEKDGQLTGTASVGYYTETIEEVLKQTKTVDAVEVVHGRWVDAYGIRKSKCTSCGVAFGRVMDADCYYCPNCGAKMDGDGNG